MRRLIAAAVVAGSCLVSACATGPQVSSTHRGNATVLGVVSVPESVQGQADACEGLSVTASLAGDANVLVSRGVVRQSRNRCTYELSGLPTDTEIKLNVQTPASWTCANGQAVSVVPADSLKLGNFESRNRDLTAACSAS
ncbi:MAG TPA: hypothetical protein VFO83_13105 [Aggregicoccus sp.]|nr:hypothetical protein [Aggregicoccus sp.]